MPEAAVVILAGGEATRLPNKLERAIGDEPMLLRVYGNVRGPWPVYIAAKGAFASDLSSKLDCDVIIDRQARRGPLAALLNAALFLKTTRLFAVAGDLPFVRVATLEALARALRPGDEAVVAEHDGRYEPLCALYDRIALIRAGSIVTSQGNGSMHGLLDRLRARPVSLDAGHFINVNTPADLALASSFTEGTR